MGRKVDVVEGAGQVGVYIDDELVLAGYTIDIVDVLKLLNQEIVEFSEKVEVDIPWLFEQGHYPEKLSEVKRVYPLDI